jgi:hypothetical protein
MLHFTLINFRLWRQILPQEEGRGEGEEGVGEEEGEREG